jgi:hypothetical protein
MIAQGFRNLDRVAQQLERVRVDLEGGKDKANRAAAAILRNKIRAALRQPGSGRFHRSRQSQTARKIEADVRRLEGIVAAPEGLSRRGLSNKRAALSGAKLRLKRNLKSLGGRPEAQGPVTDLHRASAAGEAPAPDVGLLPQGVKVGVVDGTLRVGVGGEWQGWLALHEGRGRSKGRRPYMELGLARALPDIKDRVAAVLIDANVGGPPNG